MTTEMTDFADFTGMFSFCVLFFFLLLLAVSYLVKAVVFAVDVCILFFWFFSLAPLSYSSSYILSELLPLIKNNAFTFWGWCNHCLASLGRFFLNQNPFRFVAIRFLFFGQNYPTAIAFNYLLIATSQILL